MACMLKSLGPAQASALRTASLPSLMEHLTHILSRSVPSPHPPSSSGLSFFSVTSLLHPRLVVLNFPSLLRSLLRTRLWNIHTHVMRSLKSIFYPLCVTRNTCSEYDTPMCRKSSCTLVCANEKTPHDSFLPSGSALWRFSSQGIVCFEEFKIFMV